VKLPIDPKDPLYSEEEIREALKWVLPKMSIDSAIKQLRLYKKVISLPQMKAKKRKLI
jgi:hypothetical protein